MLHFPSHALKMLAAAAVTVVCLTACFDKTISDYDYELAGGKVVAYDCGVPFDGSTWTDDGYAARLTFSEGVLQTIDYYTEEGKCYCTFNVVGQQFTFYNGAGHELQRGAFRHLYHDQYDAWKALNTQIWNVFEDNPAQ